MKNSKIKWLNNSYTKRHYRRMKWEFINRPKFRRIVVMSGIFLAFAVPLLIGIHRAHSQTAVIKQQALTSSQKLVTVKAHHRALQLNVRQLNNPEYLQQLIRDKYYYTKPGETVYSLPDDVAKDVTQN